MTTTYPDFPPYLLRRDSWQTAFEWLCDATTSGVDKRDPVHAYVKRAMMVVGFDGFEDAVNALVDWSFDRGHGGIAICWMMIAADPRRPATFHRFMPALAHLVGDDERFRTRLDVWWGAANGSYALSERTIFEIAAREAEVAGLRQSGEVAKSFGALRRTPVPTKNHVVVMPRALADEKSLSTAWKDLRDQALPLVLCGDADAVRESLRAEYPHLVHEIEALTQDLRTGEPAAARPILLTGPSGSGKSRLVKRYAELISPRMYVSLFDATASHDGTYAGSPKSWSNSQASVPARAILASQTANPICLVEEIEKRAESNHNGNLAHALTLFLDRETSGRYRDVGLDAELDLSHVLHLATANSVDGLPSHLRDRYRIIKIPAPTLSHLPALAAQVMREIMIREERLYDEPLAGDELFNIGRAWKAEKFSMRKLQRLVSATLEARDACARRH